MKHADISKYLPSVLSVLRFQCCYIVTHDYLTTIKFAHLIKQGKHKPDYLYFSNGQLYLSVGYSLLHIALLIMNDVGFIFVHRLSFFLRNKK